MSKKIRIVSILVDEDENIHHSSCGHHKAATKVGKPIIGGGWITGDKFTTYSGSFGMIPRDLIPKCCDYIFDNLGILARVI